MNKSTEWTDKYCIGTTVYYHPVYLVNTLSPASYRSDQIYFNK